MDAQSNRPRVDELLLIWQERFDRGEPVDAAELCADRPELRDEVERGIDALRRLQPILDAGQMAISLPSPTTPPPSVPPSGLHAPAECRSVYNDLTFHDRGGLGEVYKAYDTRLNRTVALKFLQNKAAYDPTNHQRFLREAEVTSLLEHPGVVPIYGIGVDVDGAPCYAMRFISGDTLAQAVDAYHKPSTAADPSARTFALRRLLQRFVNVCNTIAYAHNKGVLHRDLKPRNVMLGAYDETMVVDWGLAKRFNADGEPSTLHGSSGDAFRSSDPSDLNGGTPGFMSPEQFGSDPSAVGPPSDVYSLGATLYYVFAGKGPFAGHSLAEITERTLRGAFPRPSAVVPEVPKALEAVCLKAMALKPTDRYASPLDLALDLERWLADEPVSAYPDPLPVLAARWARRHRTAVATAAVFLVLGFAGLAVGYSVLERMNQKLGLKNKELIQAYLVMDRKNNDLNLLNTKLGLTIQELDQAYQTVRAERDHVKIARDQAMSLARGLLERARVELPHVPQADSVRISILQEFITYLNSRLAEKPTDPEVRFLTAQAYRELGNALRIIGHERAPNMHVTAIDILRSLCREFPREVDYHDYLVETCIDGAVAHQAAGSLGSAKIYCNEALRLADRLPDGVPPQSPYARTRARAAGTAAVNSFELGDYDEAWRLDERVVALTAPLADGEAPGPTDRLEFALTVRQLAADLRMLGRLDPAKEKAEEALKRAAALVEAAPEDRNARNASATAHLELGLVLTSKGEARAEEVISTAVEEFAKMVEQSWDAALYRKRLAESLVARADLREKKGDLDLARDDAERARKILVQFLEQSPRHPIVSGFLGRVLGRLSYLAERRGDLVEARGLIEQALDLHEVALSVNRDRRIDRQSMFELLKTKLRLEGHRPM